MNTRVALRYAKALFNLAKQEKEEEAIQKDISLFLQTIEQCSDLADALKSPILKPVQKRSILEEVFKDIHQISKGLFDVLVKNGRVGLLVDIVKQYQVLYDFEKLTDKAIFTTAFPVDDAFSKTLHAQIEKMKGGKVKIIHEVNPKIIGGFTLRLGDIQYDASISKKLKDLRQLFDNSHFTAKN